MFRINPHKHVKIWFHSDEKNPDTFINLENRLRLEKLRKTNRTDEITLVYSGNLLSKQAEENLFSFCSNYHLTPLSLEKVIDRTSCHDKKSYRCHQKQLSICQ